MHVIRPTLEIDVLFLENKFVNDYRENNRVLYVFSYDKDRSIMNIQNADT